MKTRVRDHIKVHKLLMTRRGVQVLPLVLFAVYALTQFTLPVFTGANDAVLGTYNPFTDEITIYEDRVADAALSLEHVRLHEELHKWQYNAFPHLLDITIVATGALVLFVLFAAVTLDGIWLKFAGLAFLASSGLVEIPVYTATMVRTGEPAFAWLFYAVLLLMFIQLGRYTDLLAGYVTREPDRIPQSMRQRLREYRWYRQDVARQKRRRRWHG
jgi:hypothetical protein